MDINLRLAFLDRCRRDRDEHRKIVELLSAGTMRTGTDDGSGWKDTTAESLATSRRIVSEMNGLIEQIEADDS